LIDDGRVILEGKVADIKQDFKENIFKLEFEGELTGDLNGGNIEIIEQNESSILLKLNEGIDSNYLLKSLIERNIIIKSFNEILPSLNEIFIKRVEHNDSIQKPVTNEN